MSRTLLWYEFASTQILANLTSQPDGMLNSTTWLYGAEVLPVAIRSKVMGLAAASHFIVNVGSKSIRTHMSCVPLRRPYG